MITQPSIQTARLRLAQHYLDKIKQAASAIRRGRENRAHWFNRIRQDWEQIKQWQAWSAGGGDTELEQARLCAAFPIAAWDILRVQLTPKEQLCWTQQALDAARRLGDGDTELILPYQAAFISLTLETLERADRYAQALMERAQAAGDTLSLGRAWYILGTASFTRGLVDRAEGCYTKCIALYEACHANEEIPIVWRGLGRVAQFRGDFQQAHHYHQQYLDASTVAESELGMLDAHVSLSGVFISMADYSAAEHHAQRAVAMARPLGKSRSLPPALFSLAHAQKWLGKYESACAHYEEGLEIARALATAPSSIANGLYGLGQALYLQGNYGASLARFEEALEIARSAGLGFRVCQIAHDMVFVHVARNELAAAGVRLQEALQSARNLATPHFLAKALAAALVLWLHLGQVAQAAIWAGLLSNHLQQIQPTLFDPAVYGQLEAELGAEAYRHALEQGKALTLDQVVSEILVLLDRNHKGEFAI